MIPEHKRKKPVLNEMTPDVIRKGTLSTLLSAYSEKKSDDPTATPSDEPTNDSAKGI